MHFHVNYLTIYSLARGPFPGQQIQQACAYHQLLTSPGSPTIEGIN